MTPDEEAEFTAFVAARSPSLLRTAYLLTGGDKAAEDLLQTALLTTLRHWNRIRDRQSLDAFVRRVMVNERRTWLRRRSSGEIVTSQLPERATGTDATHQLAVVDELARALKKLPRRQRATVVLCYLEDRPDAEVAEILGCSISTVKSQNRKALAKLRTALATVDPERSPT